MEFLVIGLGEFGTHVANALSRYEHEVVVIDNREEKIDQVKDYFSKAYVADITKIDLSTSEINIKEFDACIVTVGDNFEAMLVTIDKLKRAGAKRIVAKAYSDVQFKFLSMAGADDIYFPEKDSADRIARTICNSKLIDYKKISEDLGIYQIIVPHTWIGKKLLDLKVRKTYNLNIIAVANKNKEPEIVNPDYDFKNGDTVFVFTTEKSIKKFTKKY